MKNLLVIFACVALCGCYTIGAHDIDFEKRGINIHGEVHELKEGGYRFRSMEIDLTKVGNAFLNDIWIEIRCGEKIKLAELTQQLLNEHGFTKCLMESPKKGSFYFYSKECDAFSFESDQKGEFITFEACSYPLHWSNVRERPNSRRIGSFSSGKSVAVPCSSPELEAVFGKPDKIEHSRYN